MTDLKETGPAIAIGPRIVASGGFDLLYREGMSLIEEVAAYLAALDERLLKKFPRNQTANNLQVVLQGP